MPAGPPKAPLPPLNAELAERCWREVTVAFGAAVVVGGWERELGMPSHMVSLDFDRRWRSFPLARFTVSSFREEEVYWMRTEDVRACGGGCPGKNRSMYHCVVLRGQW